MDYRSMSLPELKEAAKNLNIKGISALRKGELIERLEEEEKKQKPKITVTPAAKPAKKKTETAENKENKADNKENKTEIKDKSTDTIQKTAEVNTDKETAEPAKKTVRRVVRKTTEDKTVVKTQPVKAQPQTAAKPQAQAPARPQNQQQNPQVRRPQNQYAQNNQGGNYQQGGYTTYRQNNNQQGNYSQYRQPNYQQPGYQNYQQNNYQQNNYQNNYQQNNNPQNYQSQNNYQGNYQQGYQNTYQQPANPQAQPAAGQGEGAYQLDSGITREGVLEVLKTEGFGFIRCDNYLPGEEDVYVSPTQIRKFGLKTGDLLKGNLKVKNPQEKYQGLYSIESINGFDVETAMKRPRFEELTPEFPHERIHLETPGCTPAMRIVDLISPVGKGQRGMIVSQPKAGKTTLLKQIANAIVRNHPDMHVIILLIDERPEEVTDIRESIIGDQVEVIYSTFDELPENHKRVSEMVIERAKRLVEHKKDVCILLDSITRLARAYNLTVENSGRTLSGGLDPAALHMPKKFFGAARCMREGGSLTILATALVDTGSRMDDVVFEEFKGTGNMELVLDRSLSERRIFPAIDLPKSGTRREDLLLSADEYRACFLMRQALNGAKSEEAIELILNHLRTTKNNEEFVSYILQYGVFGRIQVQ